MAIVQCPNGHNYDSEKHAQCPYCSGSQAIGVTVPLGAEAAQGGIPGVYEQGGFPKTMPLDAQQASPAGVGPGVTEPYQNVTQGLDINEEGVAAVVGWLVCIEGKKKGRDYRLHGERNFVGRAASNDVALSFDDKISSVANLVISYDSEENEFYVQPGEHQKNNVKHNGKLLLMPQQLNDGDVIAMGNTKLMFRRFCNESFQWE